MTELVAFHCPKHGHRLDAPPTSIVFCGACEPWESVCLPEGVTEEVHLGRWYERRKKRRQRAAA